MSADAKLPAYAQCPVVRLSNQAQGLAHDLSKTLRRLRKAQDLCESCPNYEACATCKELNTAIANALQTVWDEWSSAQ